MDSDYLPLVLFLFLLIFINYHVYAWKQMFYTDVNMYSKEHIFQTVGQNFSYLNKYSLFTFL